MRAARVLSLLALVLLGYSALQAVSVIDGALRLTPRAEAQVESGQPAEAAPAEPAEAPAPSAPIEDEAPPPEPAACVCPETDDPFATRIGTSPEELEVLRSLAERRRALDARAAAVETRESLLAAAEARVADRVEALRALRDETQILLGQLGERREAEIARIIDMYGRMEPRAAAPILAVMDDETRLLVAERMAANKLSPILSEMDPAFAAALTAALAARSVPPETAAELEARLDPPVD